MKLRMSPEKSLDDIIGRIARSGPKEAEDVPPGDKHSKHSAEVLGQPIVADSLYQLFAEVVDMFDGRDRAVMPAPGEEVRQLAGQPRPCLDGVGLLARLGGGDLARRAEDHVGGAELAHGAHEEGAGASAAILKPKAGRSLSRTVRTRLPGLRSLKVRRSVRSLMAAWMRMDGLRCLLP